MLTSRRSFIWLPKHVEENVRRLHRRRVRILAMLLLLQRSLFVPAMAYDEVRLREAINSSNVFRQLKRGVIPPELVAPFSILHQLRVQKAALGMHPSIISLYDAMRSAFDEHNQIDEAREQMSKYLELMKKEAEKSGAKVFSVFSSLLGLLSRI